MKKKISITDFKLTKHARGLFYVTYTSPTTGKTWEVYTRNSTLIDDTFGAEEPKRKNLEQLKSLCKWHGYIPYAECRESDNLIKNK